MKLWVFRDEDSTQIVASEAKPKKEDPKVKYHLDGARVMFVMEDTVFCVIFGGVPEEGECRYCELQDGKLTFIDQQGLADYIEEQTGEKVVPVTYFPELDHELKEKGETTLDDLSPKDESQVSAGEPNDIPAPEAKAFNPEIPEDVSDIETSHKLFYNIYEVVNVLKSMEIGEHIISLVSGALHISEQHCTLANVVSEFVTHINHKPDVMRFIEKLEALK